MNNLAIDFQIATTLEQIQNGEIDFETFDRRLQYLESQRETELDNMMGIKNES